MKGIKEAFIDAGEISQMLGIGMTKAYAIIKEYNAELEAKGYFTMWGKCPRKYFEQKIYGYEDYYNPDYEPQRNRSKVAEEMDYEAAVGASVISEQDEVDIPPETNGLPLLLFIRAANCTVFSHTPILQHTFSKWVIFYKKRRLPQKILSIFVIALHCKA